MRFHQRFVDSFASWEPDTGWNTKPYSKKLEIISKEQLTLVRLAEGWRVAHRLVRGYGADIWGADGRTDENVNSFDRGTCTDML